MGNPFVQYDEPVDARRRMREDHASYAKCAEGKASELGLDAIPWCDVLDCVEFMLNSMSIDDEFIRTEASAGRPAGLRQLIRWGFGDIALAIGHGLETGEWPGKHPEPPISPL